MPQTELKSFWQGFAKHVNVETTLAWNALGQQLSTALRRSGYLVQLNWNLNGTIGVTTGTAPDADTVTQFIPYIGLRSPQGLYLVSTSSRALIDLNYRFHPVSNPIADPSYAAINIGATSTQTINVNFSLPLSLNPGLNVETGIILRQIANNDFTLEMRMAASSDLAGAGTVAFANPNMTITIEAIWAELVNPAVYNRPKLNNYVRLRDQLLLTPLAAGLANSINYPVGPILLDLLWRITENAVASSTHVQSLGLYANTNNQVELRNADQIRLNNYNDYGKAFKNGILFQQWLDDSGVVDQSRMRDWINTAAASQITMVINTQSTFNTASSSAFATFRELMPLQQRAS